MSAGDYMPVPLEPAEDGRIMWAVLDPGANAMVRTGDEIEVFASEERASEWIGARRRDEALTAVSGG